MLKRYLVFGGSEFYPLGGIRDLVGDYDTAEEATDAAKQIIESDFYVPGWAHVFDSETRKILPGDYDQVGYTQGTTKAKEQQLKDLGFDPL